MNRTTETIDLKGNRYSPVASRLKQFRGDYPQSRIDRKNIRLEDGSIEFVCMIWKDKETFLELLKQTGSVEVANSSYDGIGSAEGKAVAEKKFEKLETVALGRALANIGYMASGEIASLEEMEEFLAHKKERKEFAINLAIEEIEKAKSIDHLKEIYMKFVTDEKDRPAVAMEEEVITAKDKRKDELNTTIINKKHNAAHKPGEKNETNTA